MKVHEYQAKEVLARYNVRIPRGKVARTPEEARPIAEELGGRVVVKAQIHAGGRGKAGGVKLAGNPDEAVEIASRLIGATLITHQTGPEGKTVNQVLVEEALNIEKEFYIGMTLDRSFGWPTLMVSPEGGMEIEEVARTKPDAILKLHIHPSLGLQPFQGKQTAEFLGLKGEPAKNAVRFVQALVKCYLEMDASLAEINPLILTKEGEILALDAKMNFDDNALYRHQDVVTMRDLSEEAPLEVEASKFDLNYIKLDGNVGCMVNGAGLAMATMDIIKLHGGDPANFLDVGGGANLEAVTNAFRILLMDENVKAVLVNIFGGIVRCDVIAQGIVEATKRVDMTVPLVVRLEGTNVDEGKRILQESGISLELAQGMTDAAAKVVAAAGGR
ncbi:MAG TPA: ADP-forming succinate--CoA ligase subunit beta [Thermoanaerobaculia bacterium]|nr:ADP-forming succinate--CoA ligase subunit beta [Thermoanaerobaculia bacterium]HUM28992.1 ADP-forming succinate--CoA ligase subunit beta [Thermoanaerobaculia bacterium]HXK67452.1 ADP-forming succinate--CoA ligase subunit beta [Thermoanaerobaculia bacterium]